jgi:RNA polymerase sigma-70 factor (ECF subfamily)
MQNQPTNLDFTKVYEEYYSKILRYLERLTGNKEDAMDLVQEVFVKVNQGLSKFEGRSSLSTWIYKIATNISYDRFRSTSFQKGKKQTLTEEFVEENKEDRNVWTGQKETTAVQQLERKEMSSCINRYIYDLNEDYQKALILSEYEGLKNKEIASILGITLDTVKIRIHRARVQLKKNMEQGCDVTPDPDTGLHCDEK